MPRAVKAKALSEIIAEWDALAPIRYSQISSGIDLSYTHVIAPSILRMLTELSPSSSVLDAGCGTGGLTARISELVKNVVGLDPSERSIEFARKYQTSTRARFIRDTLEHFAAHTVDTFDVVIANMVLMNVVALDEFLAACRKMAGQSGKLIFSITHPCFWPSYYGYSEEPWFRYADTIIIEAPFRITADPGTLNSTHIHRPLSAYVRALNHAGFVLRQFEEPTPPPGISEQYLAQWRCPRYLVGYCFCCGN
jgi:2-polyprenyl-3-methyl-5-hydroxy-6-metoxy-1,4-benzoquinol methylase